MSTNARTPDRTRDWGTGTDAVTSFRGQWELLSNFAATPLELDGQQWPTAEHAFQAAKTTDPAEREWVRAATSPASAKARGKRVTLRPDWEQVKAEVMRRVVRAKFVQGSPAAELLRQTGDLRLIEGNHWGDRTWGATRHKTTGRWVGANLLGLALEAQRQELRDTEFAD